MFVSYMHIHVPIIMYYSWLFVVFQEMNCLQLDVVCRVTELHLSTKFHATVSEICEFNQNKKKEKKISEIDYFQFKTFPRPIIPIFNQRYLLITCMHSIC